VDNPILVGGAMSRVECMFEVATPGALITEIEASRQQESALMAHRLAAIAALLWQRILEAEEADPDPGYAMITGFARTTAEVPAATNLSPMGANNLVPRASPAQRLSPNPVHHVSLAVVAVDGLVVAIPISDRKRRRRNRGSASVFVVVVILRITTSKAAKPVTQAVASLVAGWAVDGICHPKHSATPQRRCDGRQP
jgi:hypothetical protein